MFSRAGTYFSDIHGAELLRYIRRVGVPLTGRVLDFGCGPGYLMAHLIQKGVAVAGVDFSPGAVGQVKQSLEGSPLFKGVDLIESIPTHFAPSSFDVVFLIETVEHLLEDDLDATIREIARILRPGGWIVVSTPNAEERFRTETICPDCGCVFHTVQHVRSWTVDTLTAFAATHGFRRHRAAGVYLARTWFRTTLHSLLSKRRPHLIYIGRNGSE